jgi:hypothetical protein
MTGNPISAPFDIELTPAMEDIDEATDLWEFSSRAIIPTFSS